MIIYRGPSRIDGRPIVAILTSATGRPSQNRKTGAMAQLWIMPELESPLESTRSGADESVCGKCPLKGLLGKDRTCYVDLSRAPLSVWNKSHRGGYEPDDHKPIGRPVRFGAWGDPAALPLPVIKRLALRAPGWTGYTHQWRKLRGSWRRYLMASADSPADRLEAKRRGWRTFRTQRPGEELEAGEISCPASDEAGKLTTCERCGLCNGKRTDRDPRRDIAIVAHGAGAGNLETIR